MKTAEKTLQNMSVNEKAFMLNRLLKLKYSGTKCDGGCEISRFFENYNKETNMIIDSFMWNTYGLHYKDYLDTKLACMSICTVDVIKLEQSIDKKIKWIENLLFTPPE